MPDHGEEWDAARYEREKRNFVERRLLFRWVHLHLAVIFAVTGLAGWVVSWTLRQAGIDNMPLRYALAFLPAYGVFLLCVRLWADEMRSEHGGENWTSEVAAPDGEGCLLMAIALVGGLLVTTVFAMSGGVSLLLEVAFEVVFAGVVVKRLGRKRRLGEWAGPLVRGTWLPALVAGLVLVSVAGWLQHEVPGATGFSDAVLEVLGR